jgi:hypothetical protein
MPLTVRLADDMEASTFDLAGVEAEDPSGEKDDSYVYWIDENDLVLAPPIELSPEVREKMLASITRTLAADVGLCKTTATTSCRPYGQFSPHYLPGRRGGSPATITPPLSAA